MTTVAIVIVLFFLLFDASFLWWVFKGSARAEPHRKAKPDAESVSRDQKRRACRKAQQYAAEHGGEAHEYFGLALVDVKLEDLGKATK